MIFGVSLKTYMTPQQTREYVSNLQPILDKCNSKGIEFFVIPDLVSLAVVDRPLPHNAILGAQDCFYEDNGAFTGTVSPSNLASIGVKIVEIGHAERRRLFNETDGEVALKVQAAVRNDITPLVCIGEQERDESDGQQNAIQHCINQIGKAVSKLNKDQVIVVAYEPIWAIGKPKPAPAEYVKNVADGIKKVYPSYKLIYGGSAGPGLFKTLHPSVDGLFLGRFGHNVDSVMNVIDESLEC